MNRALVMMPFLLLAACGSRNDDSTAVSPEEDRMLNEAAASLDVNYTAAPDDGAVANTVDTGNTQ